MSGLYPRLYMIVADLSWHRQVNGQVNDKKRPLSGSRSGDKNSKKIKGELSSDEALEEKDALTLSDIKAGLKGPTVTYDIQTNHFGGGSGKVNTLSLQDASERMNANTFFEQRPGRPRKTSPYVEKPTLPEVLAHPDYQAFVKKLRALKGPEVQLVNEVDTSPSPPIDFEFVESLRLSDDVPSFDSDFTFGCECPESGCVEEEECDCLNDFAIRKFAYNKHGRVIRDSEVAIVECNDKCSCGPGCINRVVQNGRKVKLQIFKTEDKGWGKYRTPTSHKPPVLTCPRYSLPRTSKGGNLHRPVPRRGDWTEGSLAPCRGGKQARPQLSLRPRQVHAAG